MTRRLALEYLGGDKWAILIHSEENARAVVEAEYPSSERELQARLIELECAAPRIDGMIVEACERYRLNSRATDDSPLRPADPAGFN